MATLTKEQLRAVKGWVYDQREIPEWGGVVRIRALSVAERLKLAEEARGEDLQGEQAFRFFARVIMLSVVDEHGQQVFDQPEDYQLLLDKTWSTLEGLANWIMAFNGMGSNAQQELEKN